MREETHDNVIASEGLAELLCEIYDILPEECASVTVTLLPQQPIRVSFSLTGGEKVDAIDWGHYMKDAEMVTA